MERTDKFQIQKLNHFLFHGSVKNTKFKMDIDELDFSQDVIEVDFGSRDPSSSSCTSSAPSTTPSTSSFTSSTGKI
jgi:hypothetical protein